MNPDAVLLNRALSLPDAKSMQPDLDLEAIKARVLRGELLLDILSIECQVFYSSTPTCTLNQAKVLTRGTWGFTGAISA